MKREADKLAGALGRLLDVVVDGAAEADAIQACGAEWLSAEEELTRAIDAGHDPRPAREVLERCASLRRLLVARTGQELGRMGETIEKVRAHVRLLPSEQSEVASTSAGARRR